MNKLWILYTGIFLAIAFSFSGIVITSDIQQGGLQPIAMEEGELTYPRPLVGIAQQGKQEYIKHGCVYCHSDQVTHKSYRGDLERGWGDRQTVPRDYILQDRVLLGTMRTGPDLSSVGGRLSVADWHHLHLYDPQTTSKGSTMPAFAYLYKKQKIGDAPTPDAIRLPKGHKDFPEEGYEIVPTDRARKLVAFLLAKKIDYELPEARFEQ